MNQELRVMLDFNDVSDDSLNNKLRLKLIFLISLIIFYLSCIKNPKEKQLAQSLQHRIFPTICTNKKIFTVSQKHKSSVSLWGVNICD